MSPQAPKGNIITAGMRNLVRSDEQFVPFETPEVEFGFVTGTAFGRTPFELKAVTAEDHLGDVYLRIELERNEEEIEFTIQPTIDNICDPHRFSRLLAGETGHPLVPGGLVPPEWLWRVFGAGAIISKMKGRQGEALQPEIRARFAPEIKRDVARIANRQRAVRETNQSLLSFRGSSEYFLWDIQPLRNIYTGEPKCQIWSQKLKTGLDDIAHGEFRYTFAPMTVMRDGEKLAKELGKHLAYLRGSEIDKIEHMTAWELRGLLRPLISPVKADPDSFSIVGDQIDKFIAKECASPARDYLQGYWEFRPYWSLPGFELDGYQHPADYPPVMVSAPTLDVWVWKRMRKFFLLDNSELQLHIETYLKVRYGDQYGLGQDLMLANLKRNSNPVSPDRSIEHGTQVWVLPHPEHIQYTRTGNTELYQALLDNGMRKGWPEPKYVQATGKPGKTKIPGK